MPGDGDSSTVVVDNEPQCVASRRRSAREFNDGGGGERIAASEARSVEVGVDDLGTFEEKLDAASGPCGRNLDIPLVRSETHVGEAPRQVARETGCDGRIVAFRRNLLHVLAADASIAFLCDVRGRRQHYGICAVCGVA